MGVDIQIEGVSYIGGNSEYGAWWVDLDSVEVDQDIALQQTEANFDVWIRGTYSGGQWLWPIDRPRAGQEVVFTNANGEREFGGILVNAEEEEMEPNTMVYHCQCSDYSKWFDRHLVNATYTQGITVQQLIAEIVETYVNTPGNSRTFTTNNVQQFPTIPLPILQFVYIPPSEVMGQLTQMLGWGFFIDFYRDVNFFSTENFVSPLPNNILDADDLATDPYLDPSNLPNWLDFKVSEDVSQQKNRVYITGIYVAQQALYKQYFTGDGSITVFTMDYQPPNDASRISVFVGGTPYQIALDGIDGYPGQTNTSATNDQTVYVNFSAQTIRFNAAPANGAQIEVDYYPMQQTVVMVEDPQAQSYMRSIDGTDGIYEYNRMDPSLSAETPTLAQTRATMTLNKYAMPHIQGSFTSYLSGWRVGQYFTLRSQRRFHGDLDNQQMFIIRVQKKIIQVEEGGDWLFQYTIQFANVPFEF